jgi:hypothetical protein
MKASQPGGVLQGMLQGMLPGMLQAARNAARLQGRFFRVFCACRTGIPGKTCLTGPPAAAPKV